MLKTFTPITTLWKNQQRVNDEISARTQSDVVDVDEMIAQAKEEAEKNGEKFTKKDEAVIRAKAKVAAKPAEESSEEQNVDEDSIRKELGIKKHLFGYSQAELERKANGENVFPHVFGTDMYGRDILVRVMYGARVSMSVGVFAAIPGTGDRCSLRSNFRLLRRQSRCCDAAYCRS